QHIGVDHLGAPGEIGKVGADGLERCAAVKSVGCAGHHTKFYVQLPGFPANPEEMLKVRCPMRRSEDDARPLSLIRCQPSTRRDVARGEQGLRRSH
ncbi:MAG: hypothetical protein ACK559_27710, partial [bacterium]